MNEYQSRSSSMFLSQKTRGIDPVNIDVEAICPDQPIPEWMIQIKKEFSISKHSQTKSNPKMNSNSNNQMNHQNIPKHWVSHHKHLMYGTKSNDYFKALSQRMKQMYKEEPVRPYPGPIRPLNVPCDSGVALYVKNQPGFSPRKKFAKARGTPDY